MPSTNWWRLALPSETAVLGLYVHWPFCARICPYCDFNVFLARNHDAGSLLAALCADLAAHRDRIGPRRLASLHFGGGTPSLMHPHEIGAVIEAADRLFGFEADPEIGLEANPSSSARVLFEGFRSAGINRLSLGVQALNDQDLARLGRDHDAASACAAIEAARCVFPRFSIDLIYARHGQSVGDWERELSQALDMGLQHLSAYQLTIEEGTPFARQSRRGQIVTPHEDEAARFYELTDAMTRARGLPAYEVSNHAAGPCQQSRHNLLYWRSADWIGVGPGAHGRLTLQGARLATAAWDSVTAYVAAVASHGVGWRLVEELDAGAVVQERVLMGLRLAEGIPITSIPETSRSRLSGRAAEGLVRVSGDRVVLTAQGRLFTDRIAGELSG
jgi:putative oxygen-independent coproporphyrinogen III oxidase